MSERRHYTAILEKDNPRIYSQIMAGWGTRELHEAFVRMLITDATGRKGFPADTGMALMKIHMIHQVMFDFQEFKLEDKDDWNRVKRDSW